MFQNAIRRKSRESRASPVGHSDFEIAALRRPDGLGCLGRVARCSKRGRACDPKADADTDPGQVQVISVKGHVNGSFPSGACRASTRSGTPETRCHSTTSSAAGAGGSANGSA